MAQGSTRRARKARGGAPRAVASNRRDARVARERRAQSASRQAGRVLGTVGERPPGIFGGVPVSEFAIFAGLVCLIVSLFNHGGSALELGIIVMGLGVTEVSAREHFSGFRSHTTLLALMPAVIVEALYALVIGVPNQRILLLVPVIPIFGVCFLLLRRHFRIARHARVIGHR
ncbi:MAG TPA: hypothetical protein VG293_07130 [Solirubrobacteraceae bacterium]|nr:hypothetical protein [Solirubrobacteraceae bacterium]